MGDMADLAREQEALVDAERAMLTWVCKDGRKVLVSDMSADHIGKAIQLMERRGCGNVLIANAMRIELKKRVGG